MLENLKRQVGETGLRLRQFDGISPCALGLTRPIRAVQKDAFKAARGRSMTKTEVENTIDVLNVLQGTHSAFRHSSYSITCDTWRSARAAPQASTSKTKP
jgi:hypothetical protein